MGLDLVERLSDEIVYKGTGLGLFIVQGLVQANQGTINVSCESQRGCTFTIELPLARTQLKAA